VARREASLENHDGVAGLGSVPQPEALSRGAPTTPSWHLERRHEIHEIGRRSALNREHLLRGGLLEVDGAANATGGERDHDLAEAEHWREYSDE
jgi:hypothetical protein